MRFKIAYKIDEKAEKENSNYKKSLYNDFSGKFVDQLKDILDFKIEKIALENKTKAKSIEVKNKNLEIDNIIEETNNAEYTYVFSIEMPVIRQKKNQGREEIRRKAKFEFKKTSIEEIEAQG